MADVRFDHASCIYPGTQAPAVDGLDLHVEDGEFVVLVGPSGSGKTTALRMLAGLEEVAAGAVMIGGKDVTDDAPKERDVAMVFQNYALYPYLTVAANIGFPLKIARVKKAERDRRVNEAAEMLGLTEYLERKPGQLSGGQRQRVAMGRAIVRAASVFLMDEPLSNLDAKLRVQMRADIAALQARLGVTTVYVTHDQAEAMTLGNRVAVMNHGRLQQCDAPRVLYEQPVNTFVAGFIGSPAMNLMTVPVGSNGTLTLGGTAIPVPCRRPRRRLRHARRRRQAGGARARSRRDPRARRGRRRGRRGRVGLLRRRDRRRGDEARRPRRCESGARAGRAREPAAGGRGGARVRPRRGHPPRLSLILSDEAGSSSGRRRR